MAYLFASASSQRLTDTSALISTYPITLAAWARPDNITANNMVVTLNDVDGAPRIHLTMNGGAASDPVQCTSVNSSGTATAAATSAGYSANVWQHVCGVVSAADSRAVYLNGGSKGTSTTSRVVTGCSNLTVGAVVSAAGPTYSNFFSGDIAEVAVWNAALTDDEVAQLADGFSPLLVKPANLVYYIPLIRELHSYKGNALTASGGPTVSNHPRVIWPKKRNITAYIATVNYTLTADAGSYTLTGTDASLEIGYKLAAGLGSYSLTGTDASLEIGYRLPAEVGSYSLTGTAATLFRAISLLAETGSYTLTGTDAALKVQYLLNALAGTYSLTGTDAALSKSVLLTADSGTYSLTGTAANLLWAHRLLADAGVYSLTGTAADLRKSVSLLAEAGLYTLTGTDATLIYSGDATGAEFQFWRLLKQRRLHRGV